MNRCFGYLLAVHVATSMFAASASPLGRLFTTPEERDELDALRQSPGYQLPVDAGDAMPFVEDFRLDGIVVRSSGNNASWINGSSIFDGEASREGVRVEVATSGSAPRVRLFRGRDAIQLKPGQTIDVTTRSVLEGFQIKPQQEAESAAPRSTKR